MDKSIDKIDKSIDNISSQGIAVSVGISFYNAQQFLAEAITSVINQTFTDWELLLIDDGSTDNSLDIARRFENSDNRIRVISDGTNKGLSARLNELVAMSSGKYFARMDADDVMHPERLSAEYDYLHAHTDVDVVGTGVITIDVNGNHIGRINYDEHPCTIENVLNHNCFIHPSIMALRAWFVNNPYDTNAVRMEDFNLWMRTIDTNNFRNLPQALMYYRTNGLPYTRKYLQSQMGELKEIRRHKSKIKRYGIIVLKIYAKCLIYLVCGALGCTNLLLKLRTKSID